MAPLPDRLKPEGSSFRVPIDRFLPIPTDTSPTVFSKPVFPFPCSRQFSLPVTHTTRAPVIYSAPEVSNARITTESNALMEYVKSWSLDAAKRQAEGFHSVRVSLLSVTIQQIYSVIPFIAVFSCET